MWCVVTIDAESAFLQSHLPEEDLVAARPPLVSESQVNTGKNIKQTSSRF